MNWSFEFVQVTQALLPFAAAAAVALLASGANWLLRHTHSQLLKDAILEAETLAQTLVKSAEQTTVSSLKAQGKWDSAVAASVKATVLGELTYLLPADVKKLLGPEVSTYLSNLIEAKVLDLKGAKAGAVPSHS